MVEQIWKRDPNNPRIGLSLAILKLQQGQLDEADRLLGQLQKLDPNSLPVASTQVQLYLRKKQPQDAVQVCNDLVARHPDAASYLLQGRTLLATGRADAAEQGFTKATGLEPRNPDVWVSRSDFYRSRGKIFEAMADMDRALAV
jgi:predicted Zn-dependent protease